MARSFLAQAPTGNWSVMDERVLQGIGRLDEVLGMLAAAD